MDLNIIVQRGPLEKDTPSIIEKKIRMAIKLGFEVIAINTIIDPSNLQGKEIKIPVPYNIAIGQEAQSEATVAGKTFRVVTRLTAVVHDNLHCHHLMQSSIAKQYDILAVQPTTEKIFQHVCNSVEIDIISLDFTTKLPFFLKREQVEMAQKRGVHFEIQYSPFIMHSISRRNGISNCQALTSVSKGKNIIISSGAWQLMDMRGPYDAANLGFLFGLKKPLCHAAVFSSGYRVLSHSEARKKLGKGAVTVEAIGELKAKDRWIVDVCVIEKDDSGVKVKQSEESQILQPHKRHKKK